MNPLIHQFNRFEKDNQSLIQKALTTATNVGNALIPESLEQIMTDTVQRLSPELTLAETKKIASDTHKFNRITELPNRGGAMGENATTPATNSKSQRVDVKLKVVRRKSRITNFLQDSASGYLDTAAWEMQNHLRQHVNDLIYYMLYGNKDSNAWEFDGLEKFINTKRVNEVRGGVVPTDTTFLDSMIDHSNRKGGASHRRAFGMSPEMVSKVSRLLTNNVRVIQPITGAGLTQVDIGGGWRLNAYRDIPIIETTSTKPIEQMRPTITLAGVATGGGLSDDDYFIQIAPITYEGEQEASAEQTITLSGGGAAQRIRISLSDVHKDAKGVANVLAYKIYLSLATGTEKLLKIVSAFTYDSDGTITGDNGTGTNYIYIDSLIPGSDVPTHMQNDVPLVATGSIIPEIVYLWDLDPIQGLGKLPYTNTGGSQFQGLVTTEPLAKVDDYIQFLVKSYTAVADAFEATSAWHRGLRTA